LKKEKFNELYSDTYKSYWNSSKAKAGYAGVAVFTKYKPVSVTYGINIDTHDEEGRVITLEYENFYLVCVYVPNAGEGLKRLTYRVNEWDIAFFKYLNKLKEKKHLILTGDLNVAHKEIDIFEPKKHLKSAGFTIEERNSFSSFLENGYIDSFRHLHPDAVKFSYFTMRFGKKNKDENKGWRLDYFIIDKEAENCLVESDILNDIDGSDHCPIKLVWKNLA
jgi:exodeoxyribonuclease III